MVGWSIDIVKPALDKIFEGQGMEYQIDHPDSMTPRVYITYPEPIHPNVMKAIANLFPDNVYIDFKPMHLPADS